MKLMTTFDYIFYRVYKLYIGQGSSVTHTYASGLVSILQFFTILFAVVILSLILEFDVFNKYQSLFIVIPLMIYNWYRYERDFDIKQYEERWGDEPKEERRKKGWLIVLWFAVAILIPVGIGILRHNFGLI